MQLSNLVYSYFMLILSIVLKVKPIATYFFRDLFINFSILPWIIRLLYNITSLLVTLNIYIGKNVVLCMVSYKPILIAGLVMIVAGVIGVALTAPTVISNAIPDTEFNIQSPPTETEFRNPMADAEVISILLIIAGWIVALFGWDMKKTRKAAIPS